MPGGGVALRVNQGHDAIAYEDHGGEVLPAFVGKKCHELPPPA
jgi:hypothetical protein